MKTGWILMRAALLAGVAILVGCGTPYATVPDAAGRPVMLLGHDPVAYFNQGRPQRGSADFVVHSATVRPRRPPCFRHC